MLNLQKELLISSGTLRRCYRHPEQERLVVKVPLESREIFQQANQKEWRNYQLLLKKHKSLRRVAHCHGFVETNLGRGLQCDCICDNDGNRSPTLWDMVVCQEECDMPVILEAVQEFCRYLQENGIMLFDLNLKNIAMQRQADGSLKCIAIDLKGALDNNEIIPLSSYFHYFGMKKLRRRCNQLLERTVLYRETREQRRGELPPCK